MKRSFFCYSKNNCIFASPFMMRKILVILFLLLLTVVPANAKSRDTLSAGRLEFVPNMGQWTGDFDFRAALWGGALFFNSEGYVVNMLDPDALQQLHPSSPKSSCSVNKPINAAAYKVRFEGCDPNSVYNPVGDASSHYYNYYLSSDQNRWRSHVPSYATLLRPSLYPGIDFWVSQDGQYVKYEFLVAPHANPNSVKMRYEGVKSLSLNSNILIIDNYISRVVELPPFAYQVTLGGDTVQVDCKYKLSKNVVSFELGNYDAELPLIIDPQVIFSSYSGSMTRGETFMAVALSLGMVIPLHTVPIRLISADPTAKRMWASPSSIPVATLCIFPPTWAVRLLIYPIVCMSTTMMNFMSLAPPHPRIFRLLRMRSTPLSIRVPR